MTIPGQIQAAINTRRAIRPQRQQSRRSLACQS
jgi:hypothetical protein